MGSVAASISAAHPSVAAVETVPAGAVPVTALGSGGQSGGDPSSAPLSSIALTSSALSSVPLSSIPLSSIPLSSIPLSSIALGAGASGTAVATAANALNDVPLSELTISYPPGCTGGSCTDWPGVLAGTDLSGLPLQSVTLGQVLSNNVAAGRFDSAGMDVGDLGLSGSPLSSLPLSSIPLSSIPLSSIPLPGTPTTSGSGPSETDVLTTWCTTLSSLGESCSSLGIDPSTPSTASSVTLLTLALAGAPLSSIPLSSIPLSSIPLSSIPLSSIPLSSVPLSSIPLSSIPLSSIPLSSIPLSSVPLSSIADLATIVDCSGAFDCAGQTLGAAATDGALQPAATLGQFASGLTDPSGPRVTRPPRWRTSWSATTPSAAGYPDLTLGDLLLSLLPPQSYPWQTVDLAGVPLAQNESAGGNDWFTVPLQVSGGAATVNLTITLPPTFAYVTGSATVDGSAPSAPTPTPTPTPAPAPAPVSPLTWSLSLDEGAHTFSFEANAGIFLGPATMSATASTGSSSSTVSTTVTVTDGEEPDATVATATPLAPNTLNFGFMTSATDLNDWSVTVSQGQELALALTNLPAQYDLELFSPAQPQLQGAPSQLLPAVDDIVPGLSPDSTVEPTPGAQDIPVTPPSGYQLYALANVSAAASGYNGTDAGAQYVQTPPLAAGTYIVQVSGYNGATSSEPYLLRAALAGGGPALSCPPLNFPDAQPPPSSSPPTVAPGVNTLFLVDPERFSAAFGASAEATVMSDIQTVATDSAAGVTGAVVPVDAYANVQEAYATWDADPCSVQAANGVVEAISAAVDAIRASDPSVTNIVVVGADDQIPFARLADGTVESNERDYAAGTFPGENNVEADALADGYFFSDDPFASPAPLGVGSATLYLPTAAVGRLIQSPDQGAGAIEDALTRFVAADGNINATAGLSTGYSFLASGAELVSADLAKSGLSMSDLINDSWTTPQLESALTASPAPGVGSINAHFDFSRALPANDESSGSQAGLFTTTAVSGDGAAYAGRLLFSMGCHAGLDINTLEVAASGIPATADWATTFANAGALWIANTGFGYGDSSDVAYSAELMADFAGDLAAPLTIGQALAQAKQQYAAGNTVLSPYDLKSVMESTLYGLPMYTLNGASGSSARAPEGPKIGTDPITGLTEASVSASLSVGGGAGQLSEQNGADGTSYYQINEQANGQVNGTNLVSGSTLTTEFRPIEPLETIDVTEPSSSDPSQLGLVAHGALVDSLSSQDINGFTPTISQPEVDTATATAAPDTAAFPGSLQRVATFEDFTSARSQPGERQELDLVAGQFIPGLSTTGQGTQRLFTNIGAEVFYSSPSSPLASDFIPPTIETSSAVVSSGNTDFVVSVAPGASAAPVKRVLVLYTSEADPGTWTPLDLALSNGNTWSGAAPNPGNAAVQYFVEAVDAAGNVANSNNNGSDFGSSNAAASASAALSISLSGSRPTSGYFEGAVTATVNIGSGATVPVSYVLDGGPSTALLGNNQVVVTGDGEHTLAVTDAAGDTATSAFDIDTLGPKFSSATTPAISANGWVPGGFGGSSGSVLLVEVTDPGAAVASVTYQESGGQTATGTFSGTGLNLPLELPLTANGATTVTLSATDQAGLMSPSTSVTVDVDAATPRVQCAVPESSGPESSGPESSGPGASGSVGSAALGHNVSVPCDVSDDESGIAPDAALYSTYSSSAANFTLSTNVPAGKSSSDAMTPSATVCSALGDCTTVGPFGPFAVDLSPPPVVIPPVFVPPAIPPPVVVVVPNVPTVSISGPVKGATYTLGQRSTARYTCAGSDVAACTGSVPDGSYVKTGRVGKFTFTVAATNKAGKTTTTTVSYTVSYKFCQVTPPAPASSVVTFKVYLCNASGKDVMTRSAAISAVSVDGKTGPVPGRPGSATRFAFVSSPTQPFATFELNTKRLSPGPHTLRVTVPNDPATHSLAFIVRRPARARPGHR